MARSLRTEGLRFRAERSETEAGGRKIAFRRETRGPLGDAQITLPGSVNALPMHGLGLTRPTASVQNS